ncbi:MAG TPA: IS110 family transposase [Bryobacteraceae bacterium]|nr:IS110 family transposase [Bryobacteraceae bacterium]
MKKNSINSQSPKRRVRRQSPITIGIDLGDKNSRFAVLNEGGELYAEGGVATNRKALLEKFAGVPPCRIAMEVGTHSPWVSRLLQSLGHEVIVANARQLRVITHSTRKDDRADAHMLARLARIDPQLLRPVRHRSEEAQGHLLLIRARAAMVDARTSLINAARGLAKPVGERLPRCDADRLGAAHAGSLPPAVQQALTPLLEQIEALTRRIKEAEAQLEQIARSEYPETELLRQVSGVGPLIALTFVLTVEMPERFAKSRDVGCYVGLRPKRRQSGEREPELRITKEGDVYLRRLLVQGAHCILSRRAPDTDLKRWGLKLAGRGGRKAKKRAVVAVARKLAVLLHRLWVTGEVYEALRNSRAAARNNAAAA